MRESTVVPDGLSDHLEGFSLLAHFLLIGGECVHYAPVERDYVKCLLLLTLHFLDVSAPKVSQTFDFSPGGKVNM